MRASEIKRCAIINKHLPGRTPEEILKVPKTSGIKRDFVYRTVNGYKETRNIKDKPRSDTSCSKRAPVMLKALENQKH
ncbi:hypothetical protein ILUMI_26541 [Ignelater luminosus]|uniref:Uncharacterized protein n=1 Tax=Ignelater luminosus TaxID=2038154 RepID=A0A8K0FYU4_IGNLU|nr:hypothetical protein ILUMI_26541 [Ignelater luminosus]